MLTRIEDKGTLQGFNDRFRVIFELFYPSVQ